MGFFSVTMNNGRLTMEVGVDVNNNGNSPINQVCRPTYEDIIVFYNVSSCAILKQYIPIKQDDGWM